MIDESTEQLIIEAQKAMLRAYDLLFETALDTYAIPADLGLRKAIKAECLRRALEGLE